MPGFKNLFIILLAVLCLGGLFTGGQLLVWQQRSARYQQGLQLLERQRALLWVYSQQAETNAACATSQQKTTLPAFILKLQTSFSELHRVLPKDKPLAGELLQKASDSWKVYIKGVTPARGRMVPLANFELLASINFNLERLQLNLETWQRQVAQNSQRLVVGAIAGLLLYLLAGLWVFRNYYHTGYLQLKHSLLAWQQHDLQRVVHPAAGETGALCQVVNNLLAREEQLARSIRQIGEGNYQPAEPGIAGNSPVPLALAETSEKIISFFSEDRHRNWINSGLASFATLQQRYSDNLQQLSESIISELVQYLNANQGGIFILEDNDLPADEAIFELMAVYAWGDLKYLKSKIKAGEGFIGQVALEGHTVYLTELPEDFVHITSGMGGARPSAVLLLPLKINNKVHGIIEVASFSPLEPHEINFCEKLAENVAVTISAARANIRTRELLQESLQLTKQMSLQEEQMRHNMEELQQAQVEMHRKDQELNSIFKSINQTLVTVEYDPQGNITKASENLLKLLNCRLSDIIGKTDSYFVKNTGAIGRFWRDINTGIPVSRELLCKGPGGKEFWINAHYTPVLVRNKVSRIIMLGMDISSKKLAEIEAYRLSVVADNTSNAVVITDESGYTEYVNAGFTRISGYEPAEILGKKPGVLLQGPDTDPQTVKNISETLQAGKKGYFEIINYSKAGRKYWISLCIDPVFNKMGQLVKFIAIQSDISHLKFKAAEQETVHSLVQHMCVFAEYSPDGVLLAASSFFADLLGHKPTTLHGTRREDLLDPACCASEDYQTFCQQLAEKDYVTGTFLFRSQPGESILLKSALSVIKAADGRVLKIVEVGRRVYQSATEMAG